jgi:hypothetical protein
MRNLLSTISFITALLVVSGLATAQDADDPPSRVARIAYLAGPVSFEPASVDQWADASLNYPMTTGDSLYAGGGARGVLRIGQNSIRLNSGANFQFVNLSDNVVQTSVNAGSLSLHLRHLFDNESWEVDTPNGAVTLLRTGEYRVDTDNVRNATMVTVGSGDVEVTANNQSFPVHSGQTAYFDNSGNPPDVQAAGQPDDFDAFVAIRDRVENVPPPQYVSPDMVGYEDLNANGDWRNSQDYGPVWTPRVAAGWTPYHDGHWVWLNPWGWTWVDDEPWGFAPFHYGRWAYANNAWGWYPGAVAPRPYYAPALVAFVGGAGFGVGVSIGGGGGLVGWFPLGPSEAYYPSYHVSESYVRQVNVTNTRITNINVTNINVTNINYVNRSAVVAVPRNTFVSAQPVGRVAVHIDAAQMRQAEVIGAAPKVAPEAQSVVAGSGTGKAAAPPAALVNRSVVARLSPPPPAVPFAAQQQILQQHPGSPVAQSQIQTLRAQSAGRGTATGRPQILPIDTKQVRPVSPAVRAGPAPAFAQRPAGPQAARPSLSGQSPAALPVPAGARQQAIPAGRGQTQAPAASAPATREQPPPPATKGAPAREQPPPPAAKAASAREQPPPPAVKAAPAREQPPPPAAKAAPAREQPPPPAAKAAPAREQPPPPATKAAPAREQPPPPATKAAPVREQPPPPAAKAAPAREQPPPPAAKAAPEREQPPAPRPQAQPQRQPPPPNKPPPSKDEKKTEDKK